MPNKFDDVTYQQQRKKALDSLKDGLTLAKYPFVERQILELKDKYLWDVWLQELALMAVLQHPWVYYVADLSEGSRSIIEIIRKTFAHSQLPRDQIVELVLDSIFVLRYFGALVLLDERKVATETTLIRLKLTEAQMARFLKKFPNVPEVIDFYEVDCILSIRIKSLTPKDLDRFLEDEVYLRNIHLLK